MSGDYASEWIENIRQCLELEKNAEVDEINDKLNHWSAQQCEEFGFSILNLDIEELSSSLFGRFSLTLRRIDKKPITNSFKTGDEVTLCFHAVNTSSSGVTKGTKASSNTSTNHQSDDHNETAAMVHLPATISKLTSHRIEIIFDDIESTKNGWVAPMRLNKRASEVTHNKLMQGLTMLNQSSHPLKHLVFNNNRGEVKLPSKQKATLKPLKLLDLNPSQVNAIQYSLGTPPLSIIHGPPGTIRLVWHCILILILILVNPKIIDLYR